MYNVVEKLIRNAQSSEPKNYESSLLDLRLVIERFTQDRYGKEEVANYLLLFRDKSLINYRLDDNKLISIKYFLFYALFNFPDRAVLVAKCIKVLFDKSVREAICSGIETYIRKDDHTTCELIFAVTDVGDYSNYLRNERIVSLLQEVSKYGGEHSRKAAAEELNLLNSISSDN